MRKNLVAFGLTLLIVLFCALILTFGIKYPNEFTWVVLLCTFVTVFGGVFIAIRDSLKD